MIPEVALPVRLRQLASAEPTKWILTGVESDRVRSRAELLDDAETWAGAFRAAGIAAGETVLTMLPTGADAVAVWLGLGLLRAIEVPVNTEYRGELLTYLVNDSQARIMVIHPRYVSQLDEVVERCPTLERVVIVGDGITPPAGWITAEQFLAGAPSIADLAGPQMHDIAAIVYTSGTTGPSKGVVVPWAQLQATAYWFPPPSAGLDSSDSAYVPFPFHHVSVRCPVANMVMLGGAVVLREKFSSSYFWSDIRKHGCTYSQTLAGMTQVLMSQPARDDDLDNPLRILGTVPVPHNYRDFERRFGVRMGTLFTMTEISAPLVTTDWKIHDPASCGTVRPGCEVRLVDEFDYEIPVGAQGELIVRTDQPWTLNAGYWNKPEATAHAWRNGWFHTGDLFRRDEAGNYYFVDRAKDAIRRRGENISSVEVEALVAQHPAVVEVAAIGVPSPEESLGFTDEELKIAVVVKPDGELDEGALIDFLEPRMPRFMLPRYVEFVTALPKTPTFKVRKAELRAQPISDRTWDRQSRSPTFLIPTDIPNRQQ